MANSEPGQVTVLVFDDLGARYERLRRAATMLPAARRSRRLEPLSMQVDVEYSVAGLSGMSPELLAEYDAVYVDFQLNSGGVFDSTTAPNLTVDLGATDGTVVAVPVDATTATGMTVMLRLRNLMESPDYAERWRARRRSIPLAVREWSEPTGARLHTFVHYSVDHSRLFAAAGAAWFDAVFFDAQETVETMAQHMARPRAYRSYPKPAQVRESVEPLMRMLTLDPVGDATWVQGCKPTGYDWYRLYKHVRDGRRQLDNGTPLREAFAAVLGQSPRINVQRALQVQAWGNRMQGAAQDFINSWEIADDELPRYANRLGPGCDNEQDAGEEISPWPAFQWGQQNDPLQEYLKRTALFWDSPDVRLAFEEHLARRAQDGEGS